MNGRLRRRPEVRWRRVGAEMVVLQQSRNEVLALDDLGARVVELADGERTLDEMIDRLLPDFEVDRATLAADVGRFVAELLAAGVLEAVPATASGEDRP